MKDPKTVVVGGLIALLALFGLTKLTKGAPSSLFDAYMAELAGFSGTRLELDAIRWRFEADYFSGLLTFAEYDSLYKFYEAIYNSLP